MGERLAPSPGSIEVILAACAGRIVTVDIRSERRFGFGRLAVGRSTDSVVALIGSLFSVCAAAQGVAAAAAIEMARGEKLDARRTRERIAKVVAERVLDLLRGTLAMLAGARLASLAPTLRRIAAALPRFDMRSPPRTCAPNAMIDEFEQALAALGILPQCFIEKPSFDRWLCGNSVVAGLLRPVLDSGDASFGALDLKPLDPGADRMIGASLRQHGTAFSARPTLGGHVPETGALARNAGHPLLTPYLERYGAGLLVRLLARVVEVAEAPARLRAALIDQDDNANGDILRSYPMGPRIGLAAVECARGRLHHVAEVAEDGTVSRLEMLAPTEWNFHPQGSVARALAGASIGLGEPAHARVDRLVAAFDPCVAFRVHVAEAGHA